MRKLIYIRDDSFSFNQTLSFKNIYGIDYTELVSIDNLSKEDTYVYVKYFQGHVWRDMKEQKNTYDTVLWEKQKDYDIKTLYVSDNESGLNDSIKLVESMITDGGGNLNNSVLINNNRWIDKLVTNDTKIQTNSLERIVWEGAKCMVTNTEPTFDNDSKKKIFQCYNRAVNTYRTCVIVDLIKEKLID